MRKSLRLFFLCLLFVSLPMRSMAGAAAECGMDHPAAVDGSGRHDATLPRDMVQEEAHEAGHGEAHGAGHDGMPDHSEAAPQDDYSCGDCETMGSAHEASGCGTCAECCVGACGPPPVVAVTAIEETVSSIQTFSLSSIAGHIPARIERPPRAA